MKIQNNGAEFKITFNDTEYTVPSGAMDINNNKFAAFIVNKGKKWGLDIVKIGVSDETEIKKINNIEVLTEEKKEDSNLNKRVEEYLNSKETSLEESPVVEDVKKEKTTKKSKK